jgi:signal transduction histidine kinase
LENAAGCIAASGALRDVVTPTTLMWSIAAASMTLAIVYLRVWFAERGELANLMLGLVAVAVAAIARCEIGLMNAITVGEYNDWVRWSYIFISVVLIGTAFFVHLYLSASRLWLLWAAVFSSFLVLLGNLFSSGSAIGISEVHFLGERVAIAAQDALRPWQWLGRAVSCVLVVAFVIDAAVRSWRKDRSNARSAVSVIAGLGICLAGSTTLAQTVSLGMLRIPLLTTPLFMIMIVVMAFDASRRVLPSRRAQLELAELRGEAARAGRMTALGQLASSLAHELSQPVAAILRNAEAATLYMNRPMPDLSEFRAIVADVHKDAQRAGDVITQMRELMKRRTLVTHPLQLDALVHEVFSLVHADAQARQVELSCSITPGLPLVAGDRVHLSQVLLNLIINGMDALQTSKGLAKSVVIGAERSATGQIEVAVTDSGPGISPDVIDRVFDPFFTTKAGGMGMGLAISRTIVEAHGGRLWAERRKDGWGTTFRFTLPQALGALS